MKHNIMGRRHKALFAWKKKYNFRKSSDYHRCGSCAYFPTLHEYFFHNKSDYCEKILKQGISPNGVSLINSEISVCDCWAERSLQRQLGWN
jgi:hypothetical protein